MTINKKNSDIFFNHTMIYKIRTTTEKFSLFHTKNRIEIGIVWSYEVTDKNWIGLNFYCSFVLSRLFCRFTIACSLSRKFIKSSLLSLTLIIAARQIKRGLFFHFFLKSSLEEIVGRNGVVGLQFI